MNILLLQFNEVNKRLIENTLKNTKFNKSILFEEQNSEEYLESSNWGNIDLVLYYSSSLDCISNKSTKELINTIPVLFITDHDQDLNTSHDYFFIKPYHLAIDNFSELTLEKYLEYSMDQFQIRVQLNKMESLKSDLKDRDEKFNNLFENSAIGMYEVNPDGEFVLANRVFLNILGMNNIKELQKFNAFKGGISTNGTRQKLKKILSEKEIINNYEEEWIKSDKSKIIVKENVRAKKDYSGKVKYYQGFVEDITERKNVEAELIKSRKDAEKSDRLKSEFLTQISHEIRTPVNTLLSFAALIEDELNSSITQELSDSFKHMNKAGKRIIRTIDLLVKISELHTDNYEPVFATNDLFEILEDLIKFYQPLADEKNIDLQFIKAIPKANIVFDKSTITDVFSNILDNAIKFTMEGTVKVYIKNSLMNKIAVTVIDTGIGISEKYLNNIFSPFSQETNGYTRKFDGNGLGLTLVKEYCDLNNAEIFVSSEKGSGSNFTVIFK